jgi:hypothetical protein
MHKTVFIKPVGFRKAICSFNAALEKFLNPTAKGLVKSVKIPKHFAKG